MRRAGGHAGLSRLNPPAGHEGGGPAHGGPVSVVEHCRRSHTGTAGRGADRRAAGPAGQTPASFSLPESRTAAYCGAKGTRWPIDERCWAQKHECRARANSRFLKLGGGRKGALDGAAFCPPTLCNGTPTDRRAMYRRRAAAAAAHIASATHPWLGQHSLRLPALKPVSLLCSSCLGGAQAEATASQVTAGGRPPAAAANPCYFRPTLGCTCRASVTCCARISMLLT